MSPTVPSAIADPERLATLRATGLLEAPFHTGLDRLTRLTARLLGAPTALVSLVDADRQLFASCSGLPEPLASERQTPLSHSFCQHVVTSAERLVVEDARTHPLLHDNLAIRDFGVIAYAGVPLVTTAGHVLGSFCVLDGAPRRWTEQELDTLDDLAHAVSAELELLITTRQVAAHAQALAVERTELAHILDATEKLVCATGPDGRITYVNHAWVTGLGYTVAEARALRPVDMVAPEHRARYLETARRLVAGESVTGFEAVLLARDGRRLVCRGRAVPVMESTPTGQRCVGTRAFYRDVTPEHEADARRGRLLAMLDASADFVGTAAPDGSVEYMNAAGRRMLGLALDADLSTLRATDYHPLATIERLRDEALPGAARDGRWSGEGALLGPDGSEIPVSMVVVAHPSLAPNEPPYYSAVMRDLRDRVAAEEALRMREAEHRGLLAALPLVVYRVEPHAPYTPLYVSPAISMLGFTLDEWLAAPDAWLRVLHPDDRAWVLAETEAAREGGESVDYEYRAIAKDGRTRWIHQRGEFVRDAAGVVVAWQGIMLDITDRREAEAALVEREARLGLIYNSATDLMFLMRVERDADDRVTAYRCESVNEAYVAVTGIPRSQLIGRTVRDILPGEAAAHALERYEIAECTGDVLRYDESVDLPTGRVLVETTLTPVLDNTARVTHLLGVARDVSATRRAQAATRESEARFRGVLENLRAPAIQLDTNGRVTFVNDAILDITGWTRREVLGADWFATFLPDDGATITAVRRVFREMITRERLLPHYENEIMTRDGQRRLIAWDNVLMEDADGHVTGTASMGQDVTQRRALEARLAALSEHDELTALLNRRGFRRMATQELKSAVRTRRHDAVLYLDLDRFKPINDTYGHAAGDDVLRTVADLVRATIRDADFGARLGGDEFAIYAVGLAEGDGQILASRLRASLDAHNASAERAGRPYRIECSIGVAELEPGDDLDSLLARADAALYAQKLGRRSMV